jgi:N-acetylmuramoyl-L-alanine amidase CwlA
MNIVNRFLAPAEIAAYIAGVPASDFHPQFPVLHNTSAPSLEQRPHGLTEQHIQNLKSFFEGKGWHAAPHFFVDDNGVWCFSPITAPGVHSPSWNDISIGIEMLGEYDTEAFTSGRGEAVGDNAATLIAALCHRYGWDSGLLRLHREDPLTTHRNCPGRNVSKAAMIQAIHNEKVRLYPG